MGVIFVTVGHHRPSNSDYLNGDGGVCVCVCGRVRACARACVPTCVHACMLACVRACVCACVRDVFATYDNTI